MKHIGESPFTASDPGTHMHTTRFGSLPDAPLAMPKQQLEHPNQWYMALRALITGTFARN